MRWDNPTVLGETLVATVTDETAADVLGENGAVDDCDVSEVLVTSGTVQSKYSSNGYYKAYVFSNVSSLTVDNKNIYTNKTQTVKGAFCECTLQVLVNTIDCVKLRAHNI